MTTLTVEHKGISYQFADLTVRQMELLSEVLHEKRQTILQEFTETMTPLQIARYNIKVGDVLQEIRRKKQFPRFLAICLTPKDTVWTEEEAEKRTAAFESMSYNKAEKVFNFFFEWRDISEDSYPELFNAGSSGGGFGFSRKRHGYIRSMIWQLTGGAIYHLDSVRRLSYKDALWFLAMGKEMRKKTNKDAS